MKKKLSAKQAEKIVEKIESKLASPTTTTNRNGSKLVVEPKCRCGLSLEACEEWCIKGVCACSHPGQPEPKCGCFCHFDGVNFHPKGKASCSHCEPLQSEPKCLSCSGRVYKKNVCRNHYQMYGEPSQSSEWESEYRKLWLTPQGYTVTNVEQLQKIVKSFIKSLLARQKKDNYQEFYGKGFDDGFEQGQGEEREELVEKIKKIEKLKTKEIRKLNEVKYTSWVRIDDVIAILK